MKNTNTPFYNPSLSYENNYQQGPFGDFSKPPKVNIQVAKPTRFLDLDVNLPFGIPAGPLLNANYIKAAFAYGFDLCVYKTVRTKAHKSHALPNILSIHPQGMLSANLDTVLADYHYQSPISITNSFGVPSYSPEIWQEDLANAVNAAQKGQYVIGSFQGTPGNSVNIEEDYALAARLVAETEVPILEANLSCPNEGVNKLLCFDFDRVERIAKEIKNSVPDRPLFLKLAYFANDAEVLPLLKKLDGIVDGFSTINTLSAKPVDQEGKPALGADRPTGGVCGDAIRWAGLDMVKRLVRLRNELTNHFAIIGVGGVCSVEHYQEYIDAGADAVMSATGAMWNPNLAFDIKTQYS
ncbi:beta/alpha barrel domain-containing protein [Commensalibacter papalotli (ex Servin-Garciduenas et al. 2014)]|uniref:Dihydroorotate oxidase n=1 Tax=Commensalibacter papalotli (ex Servin-Garciduenas et al. 2014) TaxID=1208583 RepID=W7E224_9PROT|nr:dihydroorotate oxidase [Commensalibacter papalotli (ex Servin-Garciduenas et al. 2014)]EUK19099.1 dihydroorotate oxidase [Commensalibacter papalotli (ex Servin-Garciduenas et al. 2014)]